MTAAADISRRDFTKVALADWPVQLSTVEQPARALPRAQLRLGNLFHCHVRWTAAFLEGHRFQ